MTDHKKRAAQNNLHGSIYDHLIEAWTMADPRPPMGHSFGLSFTSYDPDIQQYLHDFVFRVIQLLIDDGCLQQPTHDDGWQAVKAVNTLHGLTGDINETTAWINRAARLAAAGVDEDTLDVLGRISTTHPVTPDDLNKLAQGSIPTPSLPESLPPKVSKYDINTAAMAVGWTRGHSIEHGDTVSDIPLSEVQAFLAALPGLDTLKGQANLYQDLLDHPFFEGWADTDMSVRDWMFQRLNTTLPDQPDEWEQCRFEDVKDTDLNVRFVFDDGSIIQGKPHMRCLTEIDLWTGYVITQVTMTAAKKGKAKIYRIPAPVTHPDPEEHPVIIVYESTVLPKGSEPQKVVYVRPYYRNDIWNGAPETITDWEPADIVAKVTADE